MSVTGPALQLLCLPALEVSFLLFPRPGYCQAPFPKPADKISEPVHTGNYQCIHQPV